MLCKSWRRLISARDLRIVGKMHFTPRQISVALRPFYFAVHPDRFFTQPHIRAQNERSLQVFNGYLSEVSSLRKVPDPIIVHFFVEQKGGSRIRKIELRLSGSDIGSIIKSALEVCDSPTANIPKPSSHMIKHRQKTEGGQRTEDSLDAEELTRKFRKKNFSYYVKNNDLIAALGKHRDAAIEASCSFQKTQNALQEEIDELKERTGTTEVIWSVDWAISHMRRSMTAVNRLIDQTPLSWDAGSVESALRGYSLRFGRGSFVCCDGGVQFGVDDVPEDWQRLCFETRVRRTQIPLLKESCSRLAELFGGAKVLVPKANSLSRTVNHHQSLITRMQIRKDEERNHLKNLGKDTCLEVVTAYDELALGKDGRLLIPCNADYTHLVDFLLSAADHSREMNATFFRDQGEAENLRRVCIQKLHLKDITWQSGISLRELNESLQRLIKLDESSYSLFSEMSLHFNTNPRIFVMTDGRISLPLSWI